MNAEKYRITGDQPTGLARFPVSTTFSDSHGSRSMWGVPFSQLNWYTCDPH